MHGRGLKGQGRGENRPTVSSPPVGTPQTYSEAHGGSRSSPAWEEHGAALKVAPTLNQFAGVTEDRAVP